MLKPKTYYFITLLLLIIFFILGVRYGQKVEKANKVIDFILSITPTQPPTPTPTIGYQEYKSRRWGLKFKYPDNLILKESTKGAEILIEPKQPSSSSAIK